MCAAHVSLWTNMRFFFFSFKNIPMHYTWPNANSGHSLQALNLNNVFLCVWWENSGPKVRLRLPVNMQFVDRRRFFYGLLSDTWMLKSKRLTSNNSLEDRIEKPQNVYLRLNRNPKTYRCLFIVNSFLMHICAQKYVRLDVAFSVQPQGVL